MIGQSVVTADFAGCRYACAVYWGFHGDAGGPWIMLLLLPAPPPPPPPPPPPARRFSKLRCLAACHFLDLLLQLFSPKI
jgi:hypothetical protein